MKATGIVRRMGALSSTSIVKGVLFVIVFQWVTRTKKQVAA